jgi:hypothetical protein
MAIRRNRPEGHGRRLVGNPDDRRPRHDDGRRDGFVAERSRQGWLKVKVAKHFFEHRYDYRSEWLRFTETLGRAGPDAALSERIVKAFADIVDAQGGLLLVNEGARAVALAAAWNWPASNPPADQLHDLGEFWISVEKSGRILELQAIRDGWATTEDKSVPIPACILGERVAWLPFHWSTTKG